MIDLIKGIFKIALFPLAVVLFILFGMLDMIRTLGRGKTLLHTYYDNDRWVYLITQFYRII